jgi:hypothetical protein
MTDIYELSGAELDAVAAGQATGLAFGAGGLAGVAAGVGANVQDFLKNFANNNDVDILNNNDVSVGGVGAAVAVLGGAGVGLHSVAIQ